MNEASRWRLELARRIAPGYSDNPKVSVVVVAGSVGRSTADRFSDIEIDVYWHEPATDEDRKRPIERANGEIKIFWPYSEDEEEWGEEYTVEGVSIGISSFLVSTMDRFLADVVDGGDTAVLKQMRIAAVQHSIPLYGSEQVARWREKAAGYSDKLARAMVAQQLDPEELGIWYVRHMLVARDDLLMLYDIFCQMERRILGALLGLNRIYLAHPGFKWLNETAAAMKIAPADVGHRLKQVFLLSPEAGVAELHSLLEETIRLAETHLPGIDLTTSRELIRRQRPVLENRLGVK
jgi:hypothetical protein